MSELKLLPLIAAYRKNGCDAFYSFSVLQIMLNRYGLWCFRLSSYFSATFNAMAACMLLGTALCASPAHEILTILSCLTEWPVLPAPWLRGSPTRFGAPKPQTHLLYHPYPWRVKFESCMQDASRHLRNPEKVEESPSSA